MFCFYDIVYHLENAEMTPELHDDLVNFSFDNFWNVNNSRDIVHGFSVLFLKCLKRLVRYHIYSCVLCIFIL